MEGEELGTNPICVLSDTIIFIREGAPV